GWRPEGRRAQRVEGSLRPAGETNSRSQGVAIEAPAGAGRSRDAQPANRRPEHHGDLLRAASRRPAVRPGSSPFVVRAGRAQFGEPKDARGPGPLRDCAQARIGSVSTPLTLL